ncbi:MAG: TonB-dependent receptor plug domain-containing protein [Parvibaculum sp.]|nr:TonB-dependent receptor plug domain-containing protein [Parvibaculum sp.]
MSIHHDGRAYERVRGLVPLFRSGVSVVALLCLTAPAAFAGEISSPDETPPPDATLPALVVEVPAFPQPSLNTDTPGSLDLLRSLARSADSAALLSDSPGVSLYKAGGISSLPALNGMADDRVNVLLNGMQVSAFCANHMNSPLSYIDPTNVGKVVVVAGITPVSLGGDSIAGTIAVDSPIAIFGDSASPELVAGKFSTFYRSNGDGLSTSASATMATDKVSVGYTGSYAAAHNYDGGGNDGEVRSSEYKSFNHELTLALRDTNHYYELRAGQQYSPYEGFPNQRMDMTENRSVHVNGHFVGGYDWGDLDARAYYRHVEHEMNFLDDKGGVADGGMPMNVRGNDFGYKLQATINADAANSYRIGSEFHGERMDDWWPAVPGSMMMAPDTYHNINGGKRDRLAIYAEWERQWAPDWSSEIGLRNDTVWMNTGDVQSYGCGMMCAADTAAAAAFNARDHDRVFVNFDATAMARYQASEKTALEFGVARKSRAPNLYELYAWGRGNMAATMIGWFGDGNGYTGNLDLDSEVANTVSATASLGSDEDVFSAKVTPYYTYVQDFINVAPYATFTDMNGYSFTKFMFVNHDAELYGFDIASRWRVWKTEEAGEFAIKGKLSYTRGRDLTTDGDLYHIMPFNASVTLEETFGAWAGQVEFKGVAQKDKVDQLRTEPQTPAYLLVNLGSSYTWQNVRFDVGVDNLLDRAYDEPLGGLSIGDEVATGVLRPLPGMGRSVNFGVTFSL